MVWAILSIIVGVILIFIAMFNDERGFIVPAVMLGVLFVSVGIDIWVDEKGPKEPTAMDVYKGKTTLEITYRDSIPVDSVVVFKENYCGK